LDLLFLFFLVGLCWIGLCWWSLGGLGLSYIVC
jgi:hypothetical protein